MRYQKRSCGKRSGYSGGGGIDWKRTILFIAVLIVAMSAISWLLALIGVPGGMFSLALLVIGYFVFPKLWRNVQISRRDKAARNRDPVDRTELIDLD